MKKLISCVLIVAFMITCLASCALPSKDPQAMFEDVAKFAGLTRDEHENYTVFTFDDFDGAGECVFKIDRTELDEGQIYYYANLTEGAVNVKYDEGWLDPTYDLVMLSASDEMPIQGAGGYVEGDEISIIFEITGLVSGEIIISFVPIE